MDARDEGRTGWLASLVLDVGYPTDTAFSRAFRREFCTPAAAWRRQQAVDAHRSSIGSPARPDAWTRAKA